MLRKRGMLMAGVALALSLAAGAAPDWKTLTDAPRNIDGQGYRKDRPIDIRHSKGEVIIAMPNDQWVLNSAGANLVANGTFEDGASGWTSQGTQSRSGWEESEGHESARSYRVRAVERGELRVRFRGAADPAQQETR